MLHSHNSSRGNTGGNRGKGRGRAGKRGPGGAGRDTQQGPAPPGAGALWPAGARRPLTGPGGRQGRPGGSTPAGSSACVLRHRAQHVAQTSAAARSECGRPRRRSGRPRCWSGPPSAADTDREVAAGSPGTVLRAAGQRGPLAGVWAVASVRQDPQTRAHWGLRAGPPQALRPPWAGGHLLRDGPGARPGHGLRLVPRGGTGGPGSPSVALPTGRPTCAPCSAPVTLVYPLVCPADHSKLGFLVESQRCSGREGDPKHSGFTFLTAEGVGAGAARPGPPTSQCGRPAAARGLRAEAAPAFPGRLCGRSGFPPS